MMANITAQMVKDLREKTGVGMMDCKNALTETGGNISEAIDWLRAKGISKAAKKADRIATEGLIGTIVNGNTSAIIELNSETDFVARNVEFQNLVTNILSVSINSVDPLNEMYPNSKITVAEEIKEKITTIGENLNLRRFKSLNVEKGVIVSYIHNSVANNLGKIGVLLSIETTAESGLVLDLGKQLAMHIAALNPISLNIEDVDKDTLNKERAIITEQANETGRPQNIIEKMVEGKINKFLEENVLLSQTFVIDNETKINDLIAIKSKEIGHPINLSSFIRMELGEGLEKKEENFADEVAATMAKS
ncbi:MAG: translation elongation factor Ts [Alphaproteobacteria bacterium]|jgi:elongation factor Ts